MGAAGNPETRLERSQLETIATELIGSSLAPSSQRAYRSAQRQYIKFCTAVGKPPLPASEKILVLIVAHLAQSVCYSTIRVYLSAVRHWHISGGFSDPLERSQQLELILRGVKRGKPPKHDNRLPITPLILKDIWSVVSRAPGEYKNVMMWAACCLGYLGWRKSTLQVAGIDPTFFSGHPFRIGAASTAAAKGIEDSTIQALGRWRSDAFKHYIRIPRQELAAISARIAN